MELENLFERYTGVKVVNITTLTPQGSGRRYFRLQSGDISLVGCVGTDIRENEAFIYLSDFLRYCQVPRVRAVSDDWMSYLMDDLGDTSLYSLIVENGGEACEDLFKRATELLTGVHDHSRGLDTAKCYPVGRMDRRAVMWDLNYFKYSFLNTSGVAYHEPELEHDFEMLARRIDSMTSRDNALMLRDCQSRNIMIKNGQPWFIDYQGARIGPRAYDLASLLWQARAGLSDAFRDRMIRHYCHVASAPGSGRDISYEVLKQDTLLMAFVRTLQVLGAYGLRGRFEHKPHFIASIPQAVGNLEDLIGKGVCDGYPYLRSVLLRLIDKEKRNAPVALPPFDGLTVRVTSFSYKKGLPDDPSGNGGGFVFDCRAMDNPGRYEQYRHLTGLDREVIDFLEARGEITEFARSCYALVDSAVVNYLSRGFTSLSVNYGCTGGQHRSVYMAQHTARHLHELFPDIRVVLCHRERGINEVL